MPARAENVAVVRHVLGALAEALELPAPLIEDVKLAVTEACTNVVRHAYGEDGDGPLDVQVEPTVHSLTVVVSDEGRGIHATRMPGGAGLGLPLMAALSSRMDVEEPVSGKGSRVRMSFAAPGSVPTA